MDRWQSILIGGIIAVALMLLIGWYVLSVAVPVGIVYGTTRVCGNFDKKVKSIAIPIAVVVAGILAYVMFTNPWFQ